MAKILKIHDPTRGDTLANWKAYLAAQKTAGTPLRILADLPTSVTRSLSPTTVEGAVGYNSYVANSGSLSMTAAEGIESGYFLRSLPFTVKVNGADGSAVSRAYITRKYSYHPDRPYGFDENGYEGETIASVYHEGDDAFVIGDDQTNLIGTLDDGEMYTLSASVVDGLGQVAEATPIDFRVDWTEKAKIPGGTVTIDNEHLAAIITPTAPNGKSSAATADIYRLSTDKPELIYSNAEFNHRYVDPYPAIGEFGGHRIVYKTATGDYITANNEYAWVDLDEEDGDLFNTWGAIIDFDGNHLVLPYDLSLSASWEKDFTRTSYLGGAVQGDWNPAVLRDDTIKTRTIVEEDADKIAALRQLAEYTGACHVRTPDGSSYTAHITVKESRDEKLINKLAKFDLSVQRIDSERLDGMTYEDWIYEMTASENTVEVEA